MISRQKAAEMLDCNLQTVSNWVKRGVIRGHKVDQYIMLDRDSILQYFDTLKDLADMEQKLIDMKTELKEKTKEMEATLDELRIRKFPSDRIMHVFRTNQLALIHLLGGGLREREREILKRTTMGDNPDVIAAEYGISRERVVQIGALAALKISDTTDFEQLVNENKDLRENNKKLNEQVDYLNEKLSAYDWDRKLASTIFMKCIGDLPFSVRTQNALKSIYCETLGDVVRLDKIDLMKARNFGKKCFSEIDDYIIKHGLHWGMRLDLMSAEELASLSDKF